MIATTIEQSKHLLDLGLDPKTADMCWEMEKGNWLLNVGRKSAQVNRGFAIPAWSLSALLEVIPKELEVGLLKTPIRGEYFFFWWTDDHHMGDDYKEPIDAAYEMVCWLLRNNLIEKGGQDGRD